MRRIKINGREIGDGKSVFIIAEAGINHNGKIELAKRLIREAKDAGADAVKFQIFKVEELFSKNSEYYDLFKSLELTKEEWMMLADYAKNIGIIFTASVFDEESAGLLEMIGSPIYKIASSDLTYLQLLNYVARKNKPIILSTGMSTIKEIKEALSEIYKVGNRQVALLHCVSSYPATYEEMNLKAISTLKQAFNVPVGLSDHTKGNIVPIVAVTIGANIIEKHFTLNKNLPGPDHKFSLEPHDFKEMVRSIRIIERALGDGDKKPTKDERDIRRLARRSITAKVSIPKGTIIAKEMIKIVRPGNGIEPKYLEFVIGKKSKEDIAKDETIKWGAL